MAIKFISPLEKVFRDKEPKQLYFEKNAYYGEDFSMQACFQAEDTGMMHVTVETDIPEYLEVMEQKFIPAFVADYSNVDDYRIFTTNTATYYPDRLDPMRPAFKTIYNRWYALWITVKAGAPVGEHYVKLTIRKDWDEMPHAEATQTFSVIPQTLEKCDIPITCWLYYDCLSDAHKMEIFSDEYFEMLENYFMDSVRHGINTVFVPLFSHAKRKKEQVDPKVAQLIKITRTENGYEFDFSRLDKFIKLAQKCGFEFFEMCHIASQQGAKHCPKIVGNVNGKEEVLFDCETRSTSKEYIEFLSAFFTELIAYYKRIGIENQCYFHVSDEPFLACYDDYVKIAKVLRDILPDAKIIDALSNREFSDAKVLTYPVVSTNHVDKFLVDNTPIWVYYCCEQSYNYLSNRFFNFPSLRTRVLGAQLYLNDAKGFLHWALNYWYDVETLELLDMNYVSDGNGAFPAGDCAMIYPGNNAPVSSIRQEVFADGIRDYRALKTLEKKKGREFVVQLLKDNGFNEYTQYTHNEKKFVEFWEKVQNLIVGD